MNKPQQDCQEIIDWKEEAAAIINDIKSHVNQIYISNVLKSTASQIFLNLQTIEGDAFCVRVSSMGFEIVAREFDKNNETTQDKYYETPYALLNEISPKYVESFGNRLCEKLHELAPKE